MEIKWTLSAALWKFLIILIRTIHRPKKHHYSVCIVMFILTFGSLYYWKWRAFKAIEESNYIYPTESRMYQDDFEAGCRFPNLNPFSRLAMKYNRNFPKVVCDGDDWIECNMSVCQVTKRILDKMKDIQCHYRDIKYIDDHKYVIAHPVTCQNDEKYILNASDCFKVSCFGYDRNGFSILSTRWHGYKCGIRPLEPSPPPPGREKSMNILILGFDSASHNGFIRKMPKSYNFLRDNLEAVFLNGYNIVGDGTPDALFPILSGRSEQEHPYARQRYSKHIYLNPDLFIFHTAQQSGYQTAYYEDMPWIGSFQYRYNGFSRCPADHYLRSFLLEETGHGAKWWKGLHKRYCLGNTPQYLFILNLTRQFMNLNRKRFCFTFIADISHDDFNLISTADDDVVDFLDHVKKSGKLQDTLLIVMGDHGPRFSRMRLTYEGKIEERMAFVSIVVPERLKMERPDVLESLKLNSKTLTTPYDIHTTLLDAMGLENQSNDFVVPNSKIRRGMSLLKKIPKSRTCDEASILPHWCVCLNIKWHNVHKADRMYQKAADSLSEYINNVTRVKRSQCVKRKLTSIEWVTREDLKEKPGDLRRNAYYQIMIVMSPGRAVFEASLQYDKELDAFIIQDKDVSRISAYGNEPACVSVTHPHLNKYCYCKYNIIKGFLTFLNSTNYRNV